MVPFSHAQVRRTGLGEPWPVQLIACQRIEGDGRRISNRAPTRADDSRGIDLSYFEEIETEPGRLPCDAAGPNCDDVDVSHYQQKGWIGACRNLLNLFVNDLRWCSGRTGVQEVGQTVYDDHQQMWLRSGEGATYRAKATGWSRQDDNPIFAVGRVYANDKGRTPFDRRYDCAGAVEADYGAIPLAIARVFGVEFDRVGIGETAIPDSHDRRVLPDIVGDGVTANGGSQVRSESTGQGIQSMTRRRGP